MKAPKKWRIEVYEGQVEVEIEDGICHGHSYGNFTCAGCDDYCLTITPAQARDIAAKLNEAAEKALKKQENQK